MGWDVTEDLVRLAPAQAHRLVRVSVDHIGGGASRSSHRLLLWFYAAGPRLLDPKRQPSLRL